MRVDVQFDHNKMDGLIKAMEASPETLQSEVKGVMVSSLMQVHATAVRPGYAPYRTGNLRRQIGWKLQERSGLLEGAVGTNVVYARIHEFGGTTGRNGSVTIQPKRYMGRAVDASREDIKDRFRKIQVLKIR